MEQFNGSFTLKQCRLYNAIYCDMNLGKHDNHDKLSGWTWVS